MPICLCVHLISSFCMADYTAGCCETNHIETKKSQMRRKVGESGGLYSCLTCLTVPQLMHIRTGTERGYNLPGDLRGQYVFIINYAVPGVAVLLHEISSPRCLRVNLNLVVGFVHECFLDQEEALRCEGNTSEHSFYKSPSCA